MTLIQTFELIRDFSPIYVTTDICNVFFRATRMHSADYAVARCPSVRLSRPRLPRADLVWWGVCVWKQSVYFVKCFITNNTKSSQWNDNTVAKHTQNIRILRALLQSKSHTHTRKRRTSGPLGWPLNTLQASPRPPLSSADLQRPPSQDAGLHRSLLRRVRSLLDPRHTLTRYCAPL